MDYSEIIINMAADKALEKIEKLQQTIDQLTAKKSAVEIGVTVPQQKLLETANVVEKYVDNALSTIQDKGGRVVDTVKSIADGLLQIVDKAYAESYEKQKATLAEKSNAFKTYKEEQAALIKNNYAEELRYIEEARDMEISAYQSRINEINTLLKSSKIQKKDDAELANIAALEDRLKYEKDESNVRYLQNAIEKAKKAYEERKYVESLQDEIDGYKDKIAAAKAYATQQADMSKRSRDAQIAALEEVAKQQEMQLAEMAARVQTYGGTVSNTGEDTKEKYAQVSKEITLITKETTDATTELVKKSHSAKIAVMYSFLSNYEGAGRSLGAAFADGFNRMLDSILNRIAFIRDELYDLGSSAGAFATGYAVMNTAEAAGITNTSLGGITQNFYTNEITPYQARKMAEDIIRTLL